MARTERNPAAKEAAKQLMERYQPKTAEDISDALRDMFSEAMEAMLNTEMQEHLGYPRNDQTPKSTTNRRNGTMSKTVRTRSGEVKLAIPRDREGSFEPQLVPKYSRDVSEIEDKVISMYGRGLSTRDISATIQELYGFAISAETVSNITDAVLPLLREWQQRPLKRVYPFVFIDALYSDVKVDNRARKTAIYVMLGIDEDGHKDVLGLWTRETEGAKEWLAILEEVKARGVDRILYLSADGLTGLEQAVKSAFNDVIFQRCIVHLIRNALKYIPSKDFKAFCVDLKCIYRATSLDAARDALEMLEAKWGEKYSGAVRIWKLNFQYVEQLFEVPAEVRRVIYTTNAIEAVNSALRKVTNRKGALPSENALKKLLYLRIMDVTKKWKSPIQNWAIIRGQLDILNPDWTT